MKKKGLNITFLFLVYQLCVYSQIDTLNNFNEKGKKHGYWKCYLNKDFKVVDSINGFYVGFDYYDNGQNLTGIGKISRWKIDKVQDSIITNNKSYRGLKILHGTIFYFDKNGSLVAEERFFKGLPLKYITYNTNKDTPDCFGMESEIVDFTKKYNNILGSFYIESRFCQSKSILKYWFRKGKRKWKAFKIKE